MVSFFVAGNRSLFRFWYHFLCFCPAHRTGTALYLVSKFRVTYRFFCGHFAHFLSPQNSIFVDPQNPEYMNYHTAKAEEDEEETNETTD